MTRVLVGDALVNEDERLQVRINQLHDRASRPRSNNACAWPRHRDRTHRQDRSLRPIQVLRPI